MGAGQFLTRIKVLSQRHPITFQFGMLQFMPFEPLYKDVVIPAGFEPATCPLGGGCSIQLSHGTTGAFWRIGAQIAMWFSGGELGRLADLPQLV